MNTLFLCTGNSARSIMAEALLRQLGPGRFKASSAGSAPRGRVHPLALETLCAHGIDTAGLASKGWTAFGVPAAPAQDLVITVCDRAAGEACPVWPGRPLRAHWGVPDPDRPDLNEDDQRRLFEQVFAILDYRVRRLLALPLEDLAVPDRQAALDAIGESLPGR